MESLYREDQIFIPIISDYGFKATFGNEANTLFLRKALQALIKSEVPIIEVKFDKNTFEGITQDGRGGIFDLVACTDENGNHFIVEMQYGGAPYFVQRMNGAARAVLRATYNSTRWLSVASLTTEL